jgi:hypothetical protein
MVDDGEFPIEQTFTISVSNVNTAPTITSSEVTAVHEDVAYSYTVTATDIDPGDNITLSAPTLPSWLTFVPASGLLSGTPTNDQVGTNATADFDVTIRATDNASAFDEQSFTITVTNINDAPEITGQNDVSTDENTPITIELSHLIVTDVDNVYPDDFTLEVQAGNNYNIDGNTITPSNGFVGTLTVPVEISDGEYTDDYDLSVDVDENVAIKELENDIASVHPIPAIDQVTFDLIRSYETVSLKIYSLTGSLLFESQYHNINSIDVNVSGFNQGMYKYMLINNDGYQSATLLVK